MREATIEDIPKMHIVRTSVNENQLSNPNLISAEDYQHYLQDRGKGWVVDFDGILAGFAIVDIIDNNVWALFVHPKYEGRGCGKMLHDKMIDWYFSQTEKTIWLSTSPGTRAETFYDIAGWQRISLLSNGEIKFELQAATWRK